MNITKINKHNKKTEQHLTKTNKYTWRLSYIMNTWRRLLKLKNKKNLKYKVSKNKHTTDKVKRHNEHLNNINKIGKYKKMNMMEKLNMMEYKTDMSITKNDIYKKTEQQFYDGAQNRHEH